MIMKDLMSIEKILIKKIPILQVLNFFKIPFVLGFGSARFKAVWRGNKKNSVYVDLIRNTFCDFGDNKNNGDILKLYYYLKEYNDDYYEIKNEVILEFIKDFKLKEILEMNDDDLNEFLKELNYKQKNYIEEQDLIKNKKIKIQIFNITKKYNEIAVPAKEFYYFDKKNLPHNNLSGQLKNIFFKDDALEMLVKKQLNPQQIYDYKFNKALIMPIYNIDTKELISLQYFFDLNTLNLLKIYYDKEYYNKEFHYNTVTKLGCFILNKNKLLNEYNQNINMDNLVFICEGLATGLTVFNLLNENYSTIIALNSFGIKTIVEYLKLKNPDLKIIILADRDHPKMNSKSELVNGLGAGLYTSLKLFENYDNLIVFSPILHLRDDKSLIIYNKDKKEFVYNNENLWKIKNKFSSDFNDLFINYGKKICLLNLALNLMFNKQIFEINELNTYIAKINKKYSLNRKHLFLHNHFSKKIMVSEDEFISNNHKFELIINDFFIEDKKELILKTINSNFIF